MPSMVFLLDRSVVIYLFTDKSTVKEMSESSYNFNSGQEQIPDIVLGVFSLLSTRTPVNASCNWIIITVGLSKQRWLTE